MEQDVLVLIFEHNNWANRRMIKACAALSDDQLDAEPQTATKGSIRATLIHLVSAQLGYLSLLTEPMEARTRANPSFGDLEKAAQASGEGLLALVKGRTGEGSTARLRTADGYWVEPWVVMVQIIDHASEHREQISSKLTELSVTPPDLDGWSYGEVTEALTAA